MPYEEYFDKKRQENHNFIVQKRKNNHVEQKQTKDAVECSICAMILIVAMYFCMILGG